MKKRITVRLTEHQYKKLCDIKENVEEQIKLKLNISDVIRMIIDRN